MNRLVVAATVASALVIGGGGLSVPAAGARGETPGPCSLLTRKQVADLLGEPVDRGRSAREGGARECKWPAREEGTGGIEGATLGLAVTVYSGRQVRREFDELVRDQENEIIDGIGDEAVADDTFAVPVTGRVGRVIFAVGVNNYDTGNWDGDPRAIATSGAELVADELARGRKEPAPVEQPDDILARFADDVPVPDSFVNRTAFGTEYDGGGAFGGDLTVDETVAFYREAFPEAGYEPGEPRTEDVDGVATTIIDFSGRGRTGQIEISPNDDPPGATLLFVTYSEQG
ncbi:MAG TPA: hypothetical protein VF152_13900 [Acidimicrobiia bacterium]